MSHPKAWHRKIRGNSIVKVAFNERTTVTGTSVEGGTFGKPFKIETADSQTGEFSLFATIHPDSERSTRAQFGYITLVEAVKVIPAGVPSYWRHDGPVNLRVTISGHKYVDDNVSTSADVPPPALQADNVQSAGVDLTHTSTTSSSITTASSISAHDPANLLSSPHGDPNLQNKLSDPLTTGTKRKASQSFTDLTPKAPKAARLDGPPKVDLSKEYLKSYPRVKTVLIRCPTVDNSAVPVASFRRYTGRGALVVPGDLIEIHFVLHHLQPHTLFKNIHRLEFVFGDEDVNEGIAQGLRNLYLNELRQIYIPEALLGKGKTGFEIPECDVSLDIIHVRLIQPANPSDSVSRPRIFDSDTSEPAIAGPSREEPSLGTGNQMVKNDKGEELDGGNEGEDDETDRSEVERLAVSSH